MGRYDDPNATIRREAAYETVAGAAGVSAKFMSFQKLRLKAVHYRVTTAGTSAGAGNCLIVKHGTTALGTATLGTNTAGVTGSLTGLNRDVASLEDLTITNGTDASGKAQVVYEFEVKPDAVKSA